MLRLEAKGFEAAISQLEGTDQENEGLKEQPAIMKQEAEELAHSRRRISLLNANAYFAQHAQRKLQHQLNSAEQQLKDRSEQRSQLEQEVVGDKNQIAGLANENAQLMEQLRLCRHLIERLTTELQGVIPLKVWGGYSRMVYRQVEQRTRPNMRSTSPRGRPHSSH